MPYRLGQVKEFVRPKNCNPGSSGRGQCNVCICSSTGLLVGEVLP